MNGSIKDSGYDQSWGVTWVIIKFTKWATLCGVGKERSPQMDYDIFQVCREVLYLAYFPCLPFMPPVSMLFFLRHLRPQKHSSVLIYNGLISTHSQHFVFAPGTGRRMSLSIYFLPQINFPPPASFEFLVSLSLILPRANFYVYALISW